jgi:AcrR family transcriptional regulator
MPRPRFTKLSAAKRERILEAAAKEFAAHGFDNASLNRILDEADISKGAAYYYFDDKADLFVTTLLHYSQELLADSLSDPAQFTAVNFWDELTAVYRHQFTSYAERPWVFGVVKAGGSLSAEMLMQGPLAELWEQAQFLLVQLFQRGRELGLIRTDLPEELLLSLVIAVDDAHDRWLFDHCSELSPADLEQAARRISDTLRRLLSPE